MKKDKDQTSWSQRKDIRTTSEESAVIFDWAMGSPNHYDI